MTTSLDELAAAMSSPDPAAVADELAGLSSPQWNELAALIGPVTTGVLRNDETRARAATRTATATAATKRGRVFLLPGIMGTDLAVLDDQDVPSLLWLSLRALAGGGLAKLALPLDGSPPLHRIHTGGLMKLFYLPMQVRLGVNWDAQLMPYDWRLDIDDLADDLADAIRPFVTHDNRVVHIVAHSMGGLVARAMIRRHPEVWAEAGGRLVMLGTPNRGSFAPILAFSGRDRKVRMIALLALGQNLRRVTEVLATFPGLYQLMPARGAGLDGVDALYDASQWPSSVTTHQALLDRADEFHRALADVVDPARMIDIAGFGHRTVDGVEQHGDKLRWRVTHDGDGTVPNSLGPLPGNTTFWSESAHGSLPKDPTVLAAIDDLLEQGSTNLLPIGAEPPTRRTFADAGEAAWIEDDDLADALDPPGDRDLGIDDAMTLLSDVMPVAEDDRGQGGRATVNIEVVWDDIGSAEADVVAVGHYEGVYPTASEAALDRAISGPASEQRILAAATARGVLAGAAGEVTLLPWPRRGRRRGSTAAVVGLGRPGTFGLAEHEVLVRNLLWTSEHAVKARTLATVLIGSGSGTLGMAEAAKNLIRAIDLAVAEREVGATLHTIKLVEFELGRARRLLKTLTGLVADRAGEDTPATIVLADAVVEGDRGTVSEETALLELLTLAASEQFSKQRLDGLAGSRTVRRRVSEQLGRVREHVGHLGDLELSHGHTDDHSETPTRLSLLARNGKLVASAISDSATVPERDTGLDLALFQSLVRQADVEAAGDLAQNGKLLLRVAVPADFRPLLRRGRRTILEVDRHTAELPWEILPRQDGRRALGLTTPLARQLRTTVSPPPTVSGRITLQRILVIGDPGAPGGGGRLPGARAESLAVVELLGRHGRITVDFLFGPDGDAGPGVSTKGAATLSNVMHRLLHFDYDIVHYAGHGTFSTDDPAADSGWMLADGLLTAAHLTMVEHMPPLLVANACHSVRLSTGLPGLADEFIGRGVRNLVGTARAVDDRSASTFSKRFYATLVGEDDDAVSGRGGALGEAVLAGRRKVDDDEHLRDWDAYQLYGDPDFRFWPAGPRPS